MKRCVTLFILVLGVVVLPLAANAESAIDSKAETLIALSDNAVILSDSQLAEIRGGLSFGGELYISTDIGLEIAIVGLEIEIVAGRPPTVQVTPPEVDVDMPTGQGTPSLPFP